MTMQLQHFAQVLIANWVLISFLAALVIAAYVKFRFGIDYFENYRNASTTKQLSEFHQEIGDRMMASSEWTAAEEAYRAALQVNPNNMAATFGIVKAQVFQPLPGKKFYAPEIVDVKLDYLIKRFPDDYQVHFLKALRYLGRGEEQEAITWLRKCIAEQPNFIGSYLSLGGINYQQSDIEGAVANFSKAVDLDHDSAQAKNNLAACHILLSDFTAAAGQFEDSFRISQSPVTALSLGEACWYSGQFGRALVLHQFALEYVQKNYDPQDRYIGGGWTSGFLPLHAGDLATIKTCLQFFTSAQMEAFAHIEVCVDQALLGDLEAATVEFDTALKLERGLDYLRIFQNRMQSAENLVKMPDSSKAWLVERRKMLEVKQG